MKRCALVFVCGFYALACYAERPAAPGARVEQPMVGEPEEELMIENRSGGVRITGTVSLNPFDQTTWNRLRAAGQSGGFQNNLDGQLSRTWTHGWFDPAATDGGCRGDMNSGDLSLPAGEYRQRQIWGYLGINSRTRTPNTPPGATDYEVHPTSPTTLEGHCIRPGRYTISNGTQTFVIDYLAVESNASGSPYAITHVGTANGTEKIEANGYSETDQYTDLGITFDSPPGNYSETRKLEIDNAGNQRELPDFTNTPDPLKGKGDDWFRFSTVNSSTNYPLVDKAWFLSRLYYDYGVDSSVRTEYYDVTGSKGLLRAHQFSHVNGARCVIVGFELKRPDEAPTHLADTTRQVAISPDLLYSCPAGPDLMPMPKSMSASSVTAGDPLTVAFREHNVGTAPVTTGWTGGVYLSSDVTCCSGDVRMNVFPGAAAIASGSYADMSLTVTVPTGTVAGQYYVFANLDEAGVISEGNETNNAKAQVSTLTVLAPPPPPPPAPPSNLIVTGVTASGASLSWTAGDGQATTTVQRRTSGSTPWGTAATVGVGSTTYQLTNLTSCTSYDVNLFHTKGGVNSVGYTVNNAFRTLAASGACPPSDFLVTQCTSSISGGKTYRTYIVAWTRGEFSTGSTYEIGQAETNNPASSVVIQSGGSFRTTTRLGPYLGSDTPSYTLYFWVRHKLSNGQPSTWVALADNPLRPVLGCAV